MRNEANNVWNFKNKIRVKNIIFTNGIEFVIAKLINLLKIEIIYIYDYLYENNNYNMLQWNFFKFLKKIYVIFKI